MKIARDSLLNLVGLGGPLLLAVVLVPRLLLGLGDERFGLLTLVWAVTSTAMRLERRVMSDRATMLGA